MVKQRMSSADLAAEVACLRKKLLGLRLANIYDLNPKARFKSHVLTCEASPWTYLPE
jgi:predicted ribosome quality control (RQC) complex YloA/Tae2 family protein